MSWLNWASTSSTRSNNPNFTSEAREERRARIEAERVIKALIDQGVDTVFGYPGGASLPIYDEQFQQKKIKHNH